MGANSEEGEEGAKKASRHNYAVLEQNSQMAALMLLSSKAKMRFPPSLIDSFEAFPSSVSYSARSLFVIQT